MITAEELFERTGGGEGLLDDFVEHRIEIHTDSMDELRCITSLLLMCGAEHGQYASKEIMQGDDVHWRYIFAEYGHIEYYHESYMHIPKHSNARIISFQELVDEYCQLRLPEPELELNSDFNFADIL